MAKRTRKSTSTRNPKIAAGTVKRGQPAGTVFKDQVRDSDEVEQLKMDAKIAAKREFANLPEELAGHKWHYKSWLWDQERTYFPIDPKLRHVELYFPYAKNGPLLIDQPKNESEKEICFRKQPAIRKAGFRYLIMPMHMNENEAREELDRITNGGDNGLDDTGRGASVASATP